jgi:hypothetical protein
MCLRALAKMRDEGNLNPTVLTKGQRKRLRASGEIEMEELDEGEEEGAESNEPDESSEGSGSRNKFGDGFDSDGELIEQSDHEYD